MSSDYGRRKSKSVKKEFFRENSKKGDFKKSVSGTKGGRSEKRY